MAELILRVRDLQSAIAHLGAAEDAMLRGSPVRTGAGFASLTGIEDEVDMFLRGVQLARASLADAAKTAARGLRELMGEASALDAQLAASLDAGFAVRGAPR